MFAFNHDFASITGNKLSLELINTIDAKDSESLPMYQYDIYLNENHFKIGHINLTIGSNLKSTYEGNLYVEIDENFRGHRYGYYSTILLFPLMRFHNLERFYACTDEENGAGRKLIDLLGGELLEVEEKPNDIELSNPSIESYAVYSVDIPQAGYEKSVRTDRCAMAIAFCGDRVLTLTTVDDKYVFPKGHIEEGENSLQAAIRECYEETGCMLIKEDYINDVSQIEYTFSGRDFRRLTDLQFYARFKVCAIHKIVNVHIFKVDEELPINVTESYNFKNGEWMKIDEFLLKNTYDDQLKAVSEALLIIK